MNKENKPHCIWIFGQAKAGKTTNAYNLMQKKLRNYILIDGDKFRRSRTPSLDYSREDIITNNKECLRMVKFLMSEGWNVVISMITPFTEMRKEIKEQLGKNVLRVYLDCEYDTRKQRRNFFDSDIVFEEGEFDFTLKTNELTEDESRDLILNEMVKREWIE